MNRIYERIPNIEINNESKKNFQLMSTDEQNSLLLFLNEYNKNNINFITCKDKFKNYLFFLDKMGDKYRVSILKEKNSDFVELFITNHKKYDKLRKTLGIKGNNKYYILF